MYVGGFLWYSDGSLPFVLNLYVQLEEEEEILLNKNAQTAREGFGPLSRNYPALFQLSYLERVAASTAKQ